MRVCAAAVCSVFCLGALAQGALAPAARTGIERAQGTGVFAGLQRSVTTPLEIVWLRTVAEIETWSHAEMRQAGVGRTGWRYIFGGNAQFAPAPNEVARLVVSSLRLPKAPFTTGKLDLSGSGRLFVIAPEAPAVSSGVALILAAGSTLQVSDAASPDLQIELKAPEDRALLLGNLASADVRRMLALLVKPGAVNASEASVSDGKVALRSGGEIELAALLDGRMQPSTPTVAVAKAQPLEFAQEFTALASAFEASSRSPKPTTDLSMDFTAVVAAVESPVKSLAKVLDFARDFTTVIAGLESAIPAAVKQIPPPVTVAAAPVEMDFNRDFASVVAAVEAPLPAPAKEAPVAVTAAVESPLPAAVEPPIAVAAASIAPVEVDVAAEAVPVEAAPPVKPVAVQVAAVHSEPVSTGVQPQPVASTNAPSSADIARMRAEVEAEIARERERLATQFKPQVIGAPTPKRFVLGV